MSFHQWQWTDGDHVTCTSKMQMLLEVAASRSVALVVRILKE